MKKLIYSVLLIFLFVFQSCQNENLSEDQEISTVAADITDQEPNNFELQSWTIDDIPSLKENIEYSIQNSSISWGQSANSENIVLDSQGILQVLDSIGNYSYAVRMYVPNSPYNVFYNVVVKEDNHGNFKQPIVLRYEVDESYYPTYSSSDRKEAPFRGDIAYYNLGSFASSSISGKEAAPVPCGSISVAGTSGNNSNGSSGSGSGSGSGGGSTSTEGDNYTNISTPSYVYVAIDSAPSTTPAPTPSVEVGIGSFGQFGTDGGGGDSGCTEGKVQSGACKYLSNDCPEEELVFPINEPGNPIFFVNCGSFEFYKPPGSAVTAAAVDNMEETFHSYRLVNGRVDTKEVYVKLNRVYFTLPSWRRNGEASNITAEAVTAANRAVELWYLTNFDATKEDVNDTWIKSLKAAMKFRGGQISYVEPFKMKNAGIYQTSLLTTGDCD
ncbi:hypothetical protein SAMN05421766_10193 [Zobellia uliginosa]|uniref:Uncharacterized protein n=2 Tax=Zobellia TaxID=112040 RepID=A0ABY1KHU2_9FLAO|nr:hypothetical protein [Zobellia uliginosa]SIS37341.1 hypothetical protein SAMN05421766_10193 [Zobellia uliginosa]